MKLHLARTDGMAAFTGYGEGYVDINGTRHTENVLVRAGEVRPRWTTARFDELTPGDFALLADLAPEILILGTGRRQRFPHPSLLTALHAARIGLEVMDTSAACRTYNILVAEGRHVACALLID